MRPLARPRSRWRDPGRRARAGPTAHAPQPPRAPRRPPERERERRQRQRRLQHRQRRDRAPIHPALPRHELGRERRVPPGPEQQRRQVLRDADRHRDRCGLPHRAAQQRQAHAPQGAPVAGAERGGRVAPARVELAPGGGEDQHDVGQRVEPVRVRDDGPGAVHAQRQRRDLPAEQQRHLRHQQRHVPQPVEPRRAAAPLGLQVHDARDEGARRGREREADRGERGLGQTLDAPGPVLARPDRRQRVREAPARRDAPQRQHDERASEPGREGRDRHGEPDPPRERGAAAAAPVAPAPARDRPGPRARRRASRGTPRRPAAPAAGPRPRRRRACRGRRRAGRAAPRASAGGRVRAGSPCRRRRG